LSRKGGNMVNSSSRVLDYLKNHGPASFQELVRKLEIEADKKNSFSYLLRRLEMEGLIKSKPINLDIAGGFLFTTLYEITSKLKKKEVRKMRIETEKILGSEHEPHDETVYSCDYCGEQLLKTISHPVVGVYIAYYKDGKICRCGKYKVFSWMKQLGYGYKKEDVVVTNGHEDVVITLNK